MPIPFTAEAVHYVAARIRHVQDVLERRIGMENVSTYAPRGRDERTRIPPMPWSTRPLPVFTSTSTTFSSTASITVSMHMTTWHVSRPTGSCMHIAGHYRGTTTCASTPTVKTCCRGLGAAGRGLCAIRRVPTLLERDFNIPPLSELLGEVDRIAQYQARWREDSGARRLNHRCAVSTATAGLHRAHPRSAVESAARRHPGAPHGGSIPDLLQQHQRLISANFPVLRGITDDGHWHALVRDFDPAPQ